ncbi:MAG: hypothetical protein ACPGVB_06385 [Chitinophagales bacterium]
MNNISNQTFQHCLYPIFTESLVKRLRERTSINLIGKVENGRSRILEDIQKCDLEGVKVILVNMKGYRISYQGFIEELNQQMDFNGRTAPKDLADWMNKIVSKKQQVCVLLDYFDALLGDIEIDEKYRDQTFVDKINSLKNRSHLSLICATTEPHKSSHFYIGAKQIVSPFLLEKEKMHSDLSYEKIKAELDRQLIGNDYWQKLEVQNGRGQYFKAIQKHPASYFFLKHIAKSIVNQSIDVKNLQTNQQLKLWQKSYKELDYQKLDTVIVKKVSGVKRFLTNIGILKPNEGIVIQTKKSSKSLWLILLPLLATVLGILNHFLGIFGKIFGG